MTPDFVVSGIRICYEKMMKRSFLFSLVLLLLVGLSVGRSVLTDNGYTDLVVAISPDLPENQA